MARPQLVEPCELLETFVGRTDHERIVHEALDRIGETGAHARQTVLRIPAVLHLHRRSRPGAGLFARGGDVELAVHGNLGRHRVSPSESAARHTPNACRSCSNVSVPIA